ncbi:hypothetical protein Cgig2_007837 [Carnegiea gigantea]|uniref:LOB domain-containing protein n=1 Tax=Carnegiea gigantea TaxID=171969 RepID=A0A9Q1GJR2_9CARY|nr:hypothetical protein Cgig2_007837 [Carnegiea gigantea]
MRKDQGQDHGQDRSVGHEPTRRASSSCAACKLLKRRCTKDCIFAPYFRADEPKKFAKVHKVFGASNVSKILQEVPLEHRHDAILSLSYEAEARLLDPVYGCLAPIAFLQHRMAQLLRDLAHARARLARYAAIHDGPPPPPLPLPSELVLQQQQQLFSVGLIDQKIQMHTTLPLISNEVICERYDGVPKRGEVDRVAMFQNDRINNSEWSSHNSVNCISMYATYWVLALLHPSLP